MEDKSQSNILKYLAVTVTSKEMRMTLESLTLGLMKESWVSRLDSYLKQQGFKRGATESNIYLK